MSQHAFPSPADPRLTADAAPGAGAAGFQPRPEEVSALLDATVQRYPARRAIDFLGRVWNWAEIGRLVDRAAAGLQAQGVAPGVKVVLCLPNTPWSVIFYFAILKAGGTVVNVNPLYTEREIAYLLADSGARILVTTNLSLVFGKIVSLVEQGALDKIVVCPLDTALPRLKGLAFRLLKRREIARIPDAPQYVHLDRLMAGPAKPAPVAIDPARDIAVLQYTGGTTGTPKGAALTHANLTINVQQVEAGSPEIDPDGERILGILPFFHVFAMTAVMNFGVRIGAELILLPRPDLKLMLSTIRRTRPTVLPGVPTLFTALANGIETGKRATDLSFINYCVSGGAPISEDGAARFERLAGAQILEGYGLSEASPVVTTTRRGHVKRGSVGTALPGTIIEIRSLDDPHQLLPQGERGEICIRGPQVMVGYYNRPEETEAAFVDGALRTGDVGYLDEDGFLFIVDRIKDLILCGGYNVYPRMIEEAACRHPAVQEAIAIAVPDDYRGEAPKLFVSLRQGAAADAEELREFLRGELNKIEMPREIEIRETLPRTPIGKLTKQPLLEEEAFRRNAG